MREAGRNRGRHKEVVGLRPTLFIMSFNVLAASLTKHNPLRKGLQETTARTMERYEGIVQIIEEAVRGHSDAIVLLQEADAQFVNCFQEQLG